MLVVGWVVYYRTHGANMGHSEGNDTNFVYVDKGDSIPQGKHHERRISVSNWYESELGTSQDVSHQVPTDYNGSNNNWDDELEHIKK